MASKGVLIDTGPLVAILSESDEHHDACVEESKQLDGPFITTWPVITEAAHLLKGRQEAVEKLLAWISSANVQVRHLGVDDAKEIATILSRFSDQKFDLADVSLMWLAEREGFETVFTIDRRDFSIFRTKVGNSLTVVPAIS